jgi:ElaB/YqjD/DUF883 family membrane-anchored ribosome-binding protein
MNDPDRHEPTSTADDSMVDVIDAAPHDGADAAAAAQPSRLGDALRRWWEGVPRDSDGLLHAMRDEAGLAREQTETYVRKEPVKAVAIAAASGAVLMGLLAAGSRSRRARSVD